MRSLANIGVKFRRGQLSLIAASPGSGKSSLAEHLALRMMSPTLYISMDCDPQTVGSRVMAAVHGMTLSKAEEVIDDPEYYDLTTTATDHIWWSFDPAPNLKDIDDEVKAYGLAMGQWPHLIVVDNLMDVAEPEKDERLRYRNVIFFLVELARQTGAHVMLLHHTTGAHTDGNKPIPRSGIEMKVDQKPRLILTLFRPSEGVMGIRVVKHTGGVADPTGHYGTEIGWLPERNWLSQ